MTIVLVTGGTGLTGSAMRTLTDRRSETFIFWGSADCDLTDRNTTYAKITDLKPSAIIHLAARSGGVGLSNRQPATLLRDNIIMALNVLNAATECRTEKIVLALSSGMYPPEAGLPLREDSIHNGPTHSSNYGYAFAKRMVSLLRLRYRLSSSRAATPAAWANELTLHVVWSRRTRSTAVGWHSMYPRRTPARA